MAPAAAPRVAPFLAALLALALAPSPARAVRFVDVSGYVGGGTQYGWLASGNPSIDGARGAGAQLVFGRRLRDRYPLYVDLRVGGTFVDVGPTPDAPLPSDRADYAMLAVGGLWDFRAAGGRRTGAWLSLHGSYHNLNWRDAFYHIDGFGVSPGAGGHLHVPRLGVFRIGVTGHFFAARSLFHADAGGQGLTLAVDYLYEFRGRDGR